MGLWSTLFGRRQSPLEAEQEGVRLLEAKLHKKLLESQYSILDNLVNPAEAYLDDSEFWWPIGSAEFVPPNADDRKKGDVLPVYTTEIGLKLLRDQSRRLVHYNPYAKGTAANRVAYICGKGYGATVARKHKREDSEDGQPDELVEQTQQVLDDFKALNGWPALQQEAVRRGDRDGEAFLRCFPDDAGRTHIRFVQPEHVKDTTGFPDRTFGVISAPQDVVSVLGYSVVEDPVNSPVTTDVPADEVVHVKLNVDSTSKRGLPTFGPDVKPSFDRAANLLRNMSIMVQVRSSYAVLRSHKNFSGSAISAFQQAQSDTSCNDPTAGKTRWQQKMLPGSIIDKSDNTTYEFPGIETNSSDGVTILQAELRAVAAALQMPEYMVSADASNGTYSSTLVAGDPSTRGFELAQATFGHAFGDGEFQGVRNSGVLWRAIYWAVEAGRLPREALTELKLQAEPPTLVVRDKDKETQRASQLNEKGVLSKTTWSKWESLDREEELAHFSREKMEEPQQAPQSNPQAVPGAVAANPGGGGPAPNPLRGTEEPDLSAMWDTVEGDVYLWLWGNLPEGAEGDRIARDLLEAGFTGTMSDKGGHKRCFSDGKPVECNTDHGDGGHDAHDSQDWAKITGPAMVGQARTRSAGQEVGRSVFGRVAASAYKASGAQALVRGIMFIEHKANAVYKAQLDLAKGIAKEIGMSDKNVERTARILSCGDMVHRLAQNIPVVHKLLHGALETAVDASGGEHAVEAMHHWDEEAGHDFAKLTEKADDWVGTLSTVGKLAVAMIGGPIGLATFLAAKTGWYVRVSSLAFVAFHLGKATVTGKNPVKLLAAAWAHMKQAGKAHHVHEAEPASTDAAKAVMGWFASLPDDKQDWAEALLCAALDQTRGDTSKALHLAVQAYGDGDGDQPQ